MIDPGAQPRLDGIVEPKRTVLGEEEHERSDAVSVTLPARIRSPWPRRPPRPRLLGLDRHQRERAVSSVRDEPLADGLEGGHEPSLSSTTERAPTSRTSPKPCAE